MRWSYIKALICLSLLDVAVQAIPVNPTNPAHHPTSSDLGQLNGANAQHQTHNANAVVAPQPVHPHPAGTLSWDNLSGATHAPQQHPPVIPAMPHWQHNPPVIPNIHPQPPHPMISAQHVVNHWQGQVALHQAAQRSAAQDAAHHLAAHRSAMNWMRYHENVQQQLQHRFMPPASTNQHPVAHPAQNNHVQPPDRQVSPHSRTPTPFIPPDYDEIQSLHVSTSPNVDSGPPSPEPEHH